MVELNERQFNILQSFCYNKVGLIVMPLAIEGDGPERLEMIKKNEDDLLPLLAGEFLQETTEEFREKLDEFRKAGDRMFRAFVLTEKALKMFPAPPSEEDEKGYLN